jgi:hypothetical protein
MTNPTYEQHLLDTAIKYAASKRNAWPGMPLTHLVLAEKSSLDALLSSGRAHLESNERGAVYLVAGPK